jgi:hypothetical protein
MYTVRITDVARAPMKDRERGAYGSLPGDVMRTRRDVGPGS